uniref:Restriction endonuclease NotI n=1 Tax=Candidatus Kentrum sp. UNK TaxID=2126344 RepID=A0A451AB39_9GAMM|nr:MAG: Restriction endonuclease NotI [Candidatus Kentron sp. UNK]VFK70778.1 MAG: Restriction endonuclease NotI [Candidatus Kentron sp. UNK]
MVDKSRNPTKNAAKRTPPHPLAEAFGFPFDNQSDLAIRYRGKRLCLFNNKVPNCTKDKANDPLGACSIFDSDDLVITYPVRFRQNWIIADDAADFFFPENARWTSLTEVQLKDWKMNRSSTQPLPFIAYRNVAIFHAYKDEFSDIPLDHWYSTTDSTLPGSNFEFDVRDLRRVMRERFDVRPMEDAALIRRAIDLDLLRAHVAPMFD